VAELKSWLNGHDVTFAFVEGSNSITAAVHEDRQYVDNGKVITSAGIAAGIDVSLHVVERLLGQDVATATARHMEYVWEHSST